MWESVIENLQISTFLLKRRLEGVLLNPFLCVFFIIFLIPYTSYSQTKELSGFVSVMSFKRTMSSVFVSADTSIVGGATGGFEQATKMSPSPHITRDDLTKTSPRFCRYGRAPHNVSNCIEFVPIPLR